MMEFTWHGLVRHGFGFANPNHAAALLCALFPFLWGWRKRAWLGAALSDAPLVLYDSSWTPKTVLPHLGGACRLPLAPGDHPLPAARILYFGDASEYASRHPGAEADFFFPSEFFVP